MMRHSQVIAFNIGMIRTISLVFVASLAFASAVQADDHAENHSKIWPSVREEAVLTYAPNVPPPINRAAPAIVRAHLDSSVVTEQLAPGVLYKYWTFNDHVPGSFIRTRVGDTLELHMTNSDDSGMPHNIDLHAVTGPGGGATVTTGVKGDIRIVKFKLLHPGLFIYHCAAPPVMDHIANGMYGLILVEPEDGLPKVDRLS